VNLRLIVTILVIAAAPICAQAQKLTPRFMETSIFVFNNFPFPAAAPLTLLSSLSGWPERAGADFFDPRSFLP
jgi:hypothetical protein